MNYLTHLECALCGHTVEADPLFYRRVSSTQILSSRQA